MIFRVDIPGVGGSPRPRCRSTCRTWLGCCGDLSTNLVTSRVVSFSIASGFSGVTSWSGSQHRLAPTRLTWPRFSPFDRLDRPVNVACRPAGGSTLEYHRIGLDSPKGRGGRLDLSDIGQAVPAEGDRKGTIEQHHCRGHAPPEGSATAPPLPRIMLDPIRPPRRA